MDISTKLNIVKQKIKRVGYIKTITSILFEISKPLYDRILQTMSSYSQAKEDIIVDKLLKKRSGFYVDIGANHPIKLNNTYRFYNKSWRGINIEPNYINHKKFLKLRAEDINLNCGLSDKNEVLKFYIFNRDVLSTFSEENAKEILELGYKIVETKEIQCFTLREILEKYALNTEIDILSIDTEGFDYKILLSNDWQRFRPKVIITESNSEEINKLLTQYSYEVYRHTYIYYERLNTIYSLNN